MERARFSKGRIQQGMGVGSALTPRSNNAAWLSLILAVALLLISARSIHAQTATATITAGTAPYSVAVNPITNKIYVANQSSASVTMIDGATNATTTVAVNTVTNQIYVTN